jgi:hypothetical protein
MDSSEKSLVEKKRGRASMTEETIAEIREIVSENPELIETLPPLEKKAVKAVTG